MPLAAPEAESPPRLHERQRDLERIAAALDSAAEGSGELLLIEGEAGIGKTALLDGARRLAAERDLVALSARASEIDRELAFGVVRQLLEPPLRRADPERRGELLSGSSALAAAPLGLSDGAGAPEDGIAALNGIFWLICNLADEAPLLLAIDDAHWADPATARLLAFLGPRLDGVGCLVLVTARTNELEEGAALAGTASDPASHAIELAPLSSAACEEIAAAAFPVPVAPSFAAACHAVSGGNPFYLRALVEELARDGVAPSAASAPRVRAISPRSVSQTLLARLASLGPAPSALAQALAVFGDETDLGSLARLAELEPSEAMSAVEALERAGIVGGGERVDFVHAITRNVVHSDIGRVRRAAMHQRIADRLGERGASAEQAAAHLIHTAPTGEAATVATLRGAAAEALGRGAPDSAIAYLRRTLVEPPPDAKRASVLLQLGVAETAVDLRPAIDHLGAALELTEDRDRRTLISAILARALFFADRLREAVRVALAAIGELDPAAVEARRGLEAIVLASASMEPAEWPVARELATRLRETGIDGDDLGAKALESALVHLEAREGLPASEAVARAERALDGDVLLREDNGRAAFLAATMILALADSERALPTLEAATAAAVERGDLLAVAGDRIFASHAHQLRGELADAIASGEEGLAHSEAHGATTGIPWASSFLAAAYLERGELDAAEASLARAGAPASVPETAHWNSFLACRAHLRALRGDRGGGLAEVLEAGRRFEAVGGRNPAFLAWRSRAALYLAGLADGDGDDRARELAAQEVELARDWGAPRTLGAALRTQGMVMGGDSGIELLREAVGVLEGSPARLEHARALVELGGALRRRGLRAEAREPLRSGLELARACGARQLAEGAFEELRATGARPRKVLRTGVESLTPSELRVARRATAGRTNREIAQELFVTQKTVEFHLSHAYGKLGISSRDELAAALES